MINKYCDKCSSRLLYNELYDAKYCYVCNEWLEKACSDDKCFHCKDRPAKPNEFGHRCEQGIIVVEDNIMFGYDLDGETIFNQKVDYCPFCGWQKAVSILYRKQRNDGV